MAIGKSIVGFIVSQIFFKKTVNRYHPISNPRLCGIHFHHLAASPPSSLFLSLSKPSLAKDRGTSKVSARPPTALCSSDSHRRPPSPFFSPTPFSLFFLSGSLISMLVQAWYGGLLTHTTTWPIHMGLVSCR